MKSVTVRLNYTELEAIHALIVPAKKNPALNKIDMKLRRAKFTMDYKRQTIRGQPA